MGRFRETVSGTIQKKFKKQFQRKVQKCRFWIQKLLIYHILGKIRNFPKNPKLSLLPSF